MLTIKWKKLDDKAVLPTKRDEDAGFDIYTTEDYICLFPGEKHLFKTGLAYSIDKGYWLLAFDRGSTGSRGIHTHCGICDNGYRGEVFVCLCNDNNFPVIFSSRYNKIEMQTEQDDLMYDEDGNVYHKFLTYPTSKAIAQLIPMPQFVVNSVEVTSEEEWEELKNNSERKDSALGASGK